MYITQESDYAVRIVYCLAKCGCRKDARSISEEMSVPLRFALKILGKLVNSGIVESYKGNRGGYELARTPRQVSLKDIIEAVEGPYKLSRCVGSEGTGECNRGAEGCCVFRTVFGQITQDINAHLAAVNFEDMLRLEHGEAQE